MGLLITNIAIQSAKGKLSLWSIAVQLITHDPINSRFYAESSEFEAALIYVNANKLNYIR